MAIYIVSALNVPRNLQEQQGTYFDSLVSDEAEVVPALVRTRFSPEAPHMQHVVHLHLHRCRTLLDC